MKIYKSATYLPILAAATMITSSCTFNVDNSKHEHRYVNNKCEVSNCDAYLTPKKTSSKKKSHTKKKSSQKTVSSQVPKIVSIDTMVNAQPAPKTINMDYEYGDVGGQHFNMYEYNHCDFTKEVEYK